MTYMYGFANLRQSGYAILQEINRVAGLTGLYRLGKPFLPAQDQRDLNTLEQVLGPIIDPLNIARNSFTQWSAQCDLELSNFKRTPQLRTFEREKNGVQKLFEKKKPDYSILATKMQSTLLALEVVERTAVKKDIKPEEKIPAGAIDVITVEKAQPYTALKRIESIFQNATGYVKIMDKYVGEHTLDFAWKIPVSIPVNILTSIIGNKTKSKFDVAFKRIIKERPSAVEIRLCDPSEFHDRYIITKNELWQSGPSLKDLGITKWGTVSKIGDATTKIEIEKKFDDLWRTSKQLRI
ncbi:MAG: hypothetical protein HY295_05020 [Thaumarchaeota archaeon]|nr:hypothetical protein [Nitrososphaerota archaeon]